LTPPRSLAFSVNGGLEAASAARRAVLAGDGAVPSSVREDILPLWVALGLAAAFGLGIALGRTIGAGLTALLWGGGVRVFVVHHVTYSINSLCHRFGRRAFATEDESRNLACLAPLALGEAWHNNHHAFPTSAAHGMCPWQLDPSAWVITSLERAGLARNVVRTSPEPQRAKATG
jgi:fatty-acid desaturase